MKILLVALLISVNCAFAQSGMIILEVEGIRYGQGGDVYAALFTEQDFPASGKHFMGAQVQVSDCAVQLVFHNVPPGWYGIAVFQDVDRNKELTTNFIGLPKEPFGFSNNPKLRFGPPAFDEARVKVEAYGETTVTIRLK